MNLKMAKAELRERVADLIGHLRIEESESVRRCVTYFERISDTLSTIRAPVLLRCSMGDGALRAGEGNCVAYPVIH